MRNLKITWKPSQGWLVFDRAAWPYASTGGFPELPALFVAGDVPDGARRCFDWIEAND